MEQISTIIVDDELLAREGLSIHIGEFSVLAQCDNGEDALTLIEEKLPDVVFVDIEMPGLNGLELIEALSLRGHEMPVIIFVTAFQEFACRAFEYQAFDYLLKPFSRERLTSCLAKVRDTVAYKKAYEQQNGLSDLNEAISLKSGTEWVRVNVDDIFWLEAAGDYVCVYTKQENYIVRKALKAIHGELCQKRFLRLNRSSIVNASKIQRLTPGAANKVLQVQADSLFAKHGRRNRVEIAKIANTPQPSSPIRRR